MESEANPPSSSNWLFGGIAILLPGLFFIFQLHVFSFIVVGVLRLEFLWLGFLVDGVLGPVVWGLICLLGLGLFI